MPRENQGRPRPARCDPSGNFPDPFGTRQGVAKDRYRLFPGDFLGPASQNLWWVSQRTSGTRLCPALQVLENSHRREPLDADAALRAASNCRNQTHRTERNHIMQKALWAAVVAGAAGVLPVAAGAQTALSGGDYVKAHNDLRAKHCVPPLKKSARLEQASREWAMNLARRDAFEHDPNKGDVSENIYTGSKTGSEFNDAAVHLDAAASWYSEIKDYKFASSRPHEDASGDIGHFTAMVWKSSSEVGCANVTFVKDGWNKVLSVCRYAAAGNDVSNDGALYKTNVPKPCK